MGGVLKKKTNAVFGNETVRRPLNLCFVSVYCQNARSSKLYTYIHILMDLHTLCAVRRAFSKEKYTPILFYVKKTLYVYTCVAQSFVFVCAEQPGRRQQPLQTAD